MLSVSDLRVRYGYGRNTLAAVDGVSFSVPPGGTIGLVGESGSGKSTVARAIVGLAKVAGGRVLLDGGDWTSRRHRPAFRRRVQMVFQDPQSSLNPRLTVGTMLEETLARRGVARSRRRAEAVRILDLVGLNPRWLERYPHQFSGGQRQRVAIARALAVEPEVVIWDEVTSALDVSVQATILNLLKALQRELGLSYVVISHDLAVVRVMSDVVAVMYLGRIVEQAETDALFEAPRHPYTQALISSLPTLTGDRARASVAGDVPDPRRPPAGCRFHTRCPVGPLVRSDRGVCLERDPHEVAAADEHGAACHFAGADEASAILLPERRSAV
jgi:oligopeptide/dipeptide ABC transporter ATP-binding protein